MSVMVQVVMHAVACGGWRAARTTTCSLPASMDDQRSSRSSGRTVRDMPTGSSRRYNDSPGRESRQSRSGSNLPPAFAPCSSCPTSPATPAAPTKSTLASPPPALLAADQWLKTGEAGALVADSLSVFCHGDVNLSNYLWNDDNLFLIDFEDSGLNDPVFEWAAMAEHFTARRAPEAIWAALADGAALDSSQQARWQSARRLVACYWLAVLLRRDQRGEIVVEVTAPEQAERVETILGGPR
jgi:Phosphotransferase enzyme family